MTAAFGYLFNRAAHEYGVIESAPVGRASNPDDWAAASKEIRSWNAPGPREELPIDGTKDVTLWGTNPIRQTSYGPYVVVNETLDTHVFHPTPGALEGGKVVRWIADRGDGWIRIYTYGYGENPSANNAIINKVSGWAIFQFVTRVNSEVVAWSNVLRRIFK